MRLWSGIIIGAMSFRNEYDGHTIDRAREQIHRLYGRTIRILAGERGYRGQKMSGHTKIMIPDVPKASDSTYMKARKHELFRKRAGIEPVIGHCKSDHRLYLPCERPDIRSVQHHRYIQSQAYKNNKSAKANSGSDG